MNKIENLSIDGFTMHQKIDAFTKDGVKENLLVFIIQWSANIGWGECEFYYDGKKWTADTESMCSNDNKEFIRMLLDVFVKQIEVTG